MAEIVLGSGKTAYIDDIDLPLVHGRAWQEFNGSDGKKYVATARWCDGHLIWTFLHKLILPGVDMVDHVDSDGLNNRRANLRPCTPTQNAQNRKRHKNNRSGFKGVYWHKGSSKWRATVTSNGKRRNLGAFPTPEDAARAYDRAAVELHGVFAHVNFPS